MNPRVTIASRVLVMVAVLAAIVAALIASAVLGRTSGTYFASLIVLPFVVAPGAIVWWRPRPGWFALWGTIALVASVACLVFGEPRRAERELGGWPAVEVAMWIAMAIATLGAFAFAFYLGARPRTADELETPLARRLRRIVHLCGALAVVCAIFGFFPGERVFAGRTFLYTRSAGGGYLVVFLALLLVPGVRVYRDPRRRSAWLWTAWSVPASLLVIAVVVGLHIFTHGEDLWPLVVVRFAAFTIIVLLMVGMPMIALFTRDGVRLPEARVRASSA